MPGICGISSDTNDHKRFRRVHAALYTALASGGFHALDRPGVWPEPHFARITFEGSAFFPAMSLRQTNVEVGQEDRVAVRKLPFGA